MPTNKQKIHRLLKGIETGDPDAALVVNEDVYIQHNPHTQEGNAGLAKLFASLSKSDPKVTMVRAFEDSDYVFAHMEYDFSNTKVAFEVFRFEGGYAVEHWDNIQPMQGPNSSGRTMQGGEKESNEKHKTEANRQLVRQFVEGVLIEHQTDRIEEFVAADSFIQHSPVIADGIDALRDALCAESLLGLMIQYHKLHKVLAEGNFVLSISEGYLDGVHCAFYDLFRVEENKLVEHWDTIEAIPPVSEWKNTNGKF